MKKLYESAGTLPHERKILLYDPSIGHCSKVPEVHFLAQVLRVEALQFLVCAWSSVLCARALRGACQGHVPSAAARGSR